MSPMAAPTLMGLFLVISRTMASSQFVIIQETKTYEQASAYCASTYGTTLATIRNDYDANDLLELRQDLGSVHTWVGLKVDSAGEWKWDSGFACDGDCQSIKYWDNGQPQANTEECTVINGNVNEIDNLHDVTCTNTYPQFACDVPVMGLRMAAVEEGLTTVNTKVSAVETDVATMESKVSAVETELSTVTSKVSVVETGLATVSYLEAGRYKLIQGTKTWSDANDYCVDIYGTTLATIRDDDDANLLFEMTQSIGDNHVLIGLNDMETDGDYEWISGFQCDGDCAAVSWWAGGQHNDIEDCTVAVYYATGIDDLVHDVKCTNTYPYFACDVPVMANRVGDVETVVDAMGTRVDTLEQELATVDGEVEDVNTKMSAVEQDLATVQSDVDAVEALASLGSERYTMIVNHTTKQQASNYCAETYGTTLATIRNDADAQDLWNQALGAYNAWVGLTKISAGVWEWDSGFECDGGDCQSINWWNSNGGQPENVDDQLCVLIRKGVDGIDNLHDAYCDHDIQTAFFCDTPFMATQIEMASMQTRLNSLERIVSGFDAAIDAEQSVSAPVGFGVYADYALYALALANLVVLLCLFAFCMVRRVPTKVQYGRVYDSETETDKL